MAAEERSANGRAVSCPGIVTLLLSVVLSALAFPWGFITFLFLAITICLLIAGDDFHCRYACLMVALGALLVMAGVTVLGMMVAFLIDGDALVTLLTSQEKAADFLYSAAFALPAYVLIAGGVCLLALGDGVHLPVRLKRARRRSY